MKLEKDNDEKHVPSICFSRHPILPGSNESPSFVSRFDTV